MIPSLLPRMTAVRMLQELRGAHAQVRGCLDEMAELTSELTADRLKYTAARYRISKASMARRMCFNAICEELSGSGTSEDLAVIERLRGLDRELMSTSASHVAQWTAASIYSDWQGYCAASRRIRRHMAVELDAEETQLFPRVERSLEAKAAQRSRAA